MISSCIISDEHFQGFTVHVDVKLFDSVKDLINHVKMKLQSVLIHHDLKLLLMKLDNLKFHIHDVKFIHELYNQEIIYICSHNSS